MPKTFQQQMLGFPPRATAVAAILAVAAAAGDGCGVATKPMPTIDAVCEQGVATKPTPTIGKKKKKYFNATTAANIYGRPKPKHALKFSDYVGRVADGLGDHVVKYAESGSPLATKSEALRGAIAEGVTKRYMTNTYDLGHCQGRDVGERQRPGPWRRQGEVRLRSAYA